MAAKTTRTRGRSPRKGAAPTNEKVYAALISPSTGQVALVEEGTGLFDQVSQAIAAVVAVEHPGQRRMTLTQGTYTGRAATRTTAYQWLTGTVLPSLRQRLLPDPTNLAVIIESVEFYRKHHPWVNRALTLRSGINAAQFRINAPGNKEQDKWMLDLKRRLRMYSFMREFFWQMRAFGQVVSLWRTEPNGRDVKSIECASLQVYQPRFNAFDGSRPRIVVIPANDANLRRLADEVRGADAAKKATAKMQLAAYPSPIREAVMARSRTPVEVSAEALEPLGFHFGYTAYDKRHYEDWGFPGMYSIFPYIEMLMLADDADINALHHYKAGILLVKVGPREPSAENVELIPGTTELKALETRLEGMIKARMPHWAARGDLTIEWVVPPAHIMNPDKVQSAKEKVLDWLGILRIAFPGQDISGAYASWAAAMKILQQESEDERQLASEFAEEWFFQLSESSNAFKGAVWPTAWFDPNALNEPRIILEMARLFKQFGGADERTIAEMFGYDANVWAARRKELKGKDFSPSFIPPRSGGGFSAAPEGRPPTTGQPTPEDGGGRQPRPSTAEAAEIVHRRFGISADEVRQALDEEYIAND